MSDQQDASSLMGDLDGSMIPMPIIVLVALTEGIKVVTEPSDELVDKIGRTLFEYLVPVLGLEDKIHVKDMWWKAARDALAVIREEVHEQCYGKEPCDQQGLDRSINVRSSSGQESGTE